MFLTPDELRRQAALIREPERPAAPPPQSMGERIGAHAYNFPKNAALALGGMATSAWDFLSGTPAAVREYEAEELERQRPSMMYESARVAPAKTGGEVVADVIGGIAPELPALMLPMSGFTKAGRVLGLSKRVAPLPAGIATGAISGYRHSPGEAALQAGEFGIMEAVGAAMPGTVRPLMRAVTQGITGYGVGMAGQMARGGDPMSVEGQTQAGIMGALPLAMHGARRIFRRTPTEPTVTPLPDTPPDLGPSPDVTPAGKRLVRVVETPEGFRHDFETPDGVQSMMSREPMRAPGRRPMASPVGDDVATLPGAAEGDAFAGLRRKTTSAEPEGGVLPEATAEAPAVPRQGLRPLRGGTEGSINQSLLHSLAGGTVGATVGYALPGTDEQRRNRAMMMGAAGAMIGGGRRLFRTVVSTEGAEAGRRAQVGEGRSFLGSTRRFAEKYLKLGRSKSLDTAQEQARGTVGAIQEQVAADLRAAIPGLKSLTPAQRQALKVWEASDRGAVARSILRGASLPPEVQQWAFRTTVNKARLQRMLADAQTDPQKAALIRQTLGSYVTEPYRAFTQPHIWQKEGISPALKARLVQLNMRDPRFRGMSKDAVTKDIEAWMAEVGNFGGDFARYATEGKSRMSRSLFTSRKKLRPIVQKILGKVRDPVEREVLTVAKLAKSATTAKLVTELQQPHAVDGQGHRLTMDRQQWEAELASARASGNTAQEQFLLGNYELVPDTIPGLGTLSGGGGKRMMAQRQALDALQAGPGHGIVNWDDSVIAMLNRIPKAAHTLYTPGTHLHNVVQAPLLAVASGLNPVTFITNIRRMWANPQRMKWAKEDGILDAHLGAGEFRRAADSLEDLMNPTLAQRTIGRLHEGVKHLYGAPDRWARAAAYNKFLDEGLAKGMKAPEARRYAVEMTNRYTQNYSNVAPAVGLLRNMPLVNPFISYTAEMLRILKNLADDVVNNSNGRRWQSAAALTTYLGLGAGITALVNSGTVPEDQVEKLKSLIPLLPPYMRNQTRPVVGMEDGKANMLNLNPWLPAEDFVETAKSILRGDWDSVKERNPVAGITRTPAFNVLAELQSGEDPVTGQPSEGVLSAVQKNALPGWFPGVPGVTPPNYTAQKLIKGFTRNDKGTLGVTDASGRKETPLSALGALAGVSVAGVDLERLEGRALAGKKRLFAAEKTKLNRVLRSDINDAAKEEAVREFEEKARRIFGPE